MLVINLINFFQRQWYFFKIIISNVLFPFLPISKVAELKKINNKYVVHMGIMLIKLILKNFYPDRLRLDSRLTHFYIVKTSICNACLLSFPSREICYDIFIVVVNKNLTKPGNIKTKHYSATDGSGLCLKALLITSLRISTTTHVIY